MLYMEVHLTSYQNSKNQKQLNNIQEKRHKYLNQNECYKRQLGVDLVNPPAINSNLALAPSERIQVPHLNHGIRKIGVECIPIVAIHGNDRVG